MFATIYTLCYKVPQIFHCIQLYVGKTDIMDKRSEVTWKFDFSDCGLVVRRFRVKGRSSDDDEIDWRVIGDERVGCRPMLAGGYNTDFVSS